MTAKLAACISLKLYSHAWLHKKQELKNLGNKKFEHHSS